MAPKRKREPPDKPPPDASFTVKCGLASFCKNANLKSMISHAVRDVSQITWELSKLLNLHFVHACEHGLHIFALDRQNDLYTLCYGVSGLEGGCHDKGLTDLSTHGQPQIAAVAQAQHVYFQQRPTNLPWAPRNRIGQILKSASQTY